MIIWLDNPIQPLAIILVGIVCCVGLVLTHLRASKARANRLIEKGDADLASVHDRDLDPPLPRIASSVEIEPQMPAHATQRDKSSSFGTVEMHRVIYKFLPALRGCLLTGQDLEGYFADAVERAAALGWSIEDLLSAARSNKWPNRTRKNREY